MFSLPRTLIATLSIATLLGLFSTTALPVVTGDPGQAQAAAKKKKKKKAVVRTRQS
jgi:hypothetical protein